MPEINEVTVKTFSDIENSLITTLEDQQQFLSPNKPKLSDFTPGSVIGTLIRSIAITLSSYWDYLEELVKGFYVSTATGDKLDRRLADFSFARKIGNPASGKVAVIRPKDVNFRGNIPAGTILTKGSLVFTTAATSSDFPSSTDRAVVFVDVTSTGNSTESNLVANTALTPINTTYSGLTFIVGSILNSDKTQATSGGLVGGLDDETDENVRTRFQTYIQNLGKGTPQVIKTAVQAVSGVRQCQIYDNSRVVAGEITGNNPGYIVVQVQPTNIVEGLSASLQAAISIAVEANKAAGIAYEIYSIPVKSVNLTVTIKTALANNSNEWQTYQNALSDYVTEFFNNLAVQQAFYPAALAAQLYQLNTINAPAGIIIGCTDDSGMSIIESDGRVVPEQPDGILSLGDIDFVHQGL